MTQHDEHRSLYLSYLERCNDHDLEGMATFYAPSMKVNGVPTESSVVTRQFEPTIAAFPDWHWDLQHIVIDGDDIVVHFTVTGTHRGTFEGIEATGRPVTLAQFTLYRLVDGKFAEVWDLVDTHALLQQIG